MKFQELELKYYVQDLKKIEHHLIDLGAICVQPRIQELNLRFDTDDYSLGRAGKALRLRYDTQARLTFKGPSQSEEGVRLRQEIEFVADDFQAAQAFLLALGFKVSVIYEKYRTSYDLQGVHVVLDELPYGNFIEIEGEQASQIREMNERLGLNWEVRIPESYTVLFDRLRLNWNLQFRDLTFDNFVGLSFSAADLGVFPADN
jgi:adenylate cyclase, class 2